ncbi:MAG: hypothetical protein ACXWJJ_02900 [Ramlibacter sp.]
MDTLKPAATGRAATAGARADNPPPGASPPDNAPERDAIAQRRSGLASTWAGDGGDIWGLALSGGGIRSATFCFGLLRGLARASSLPRFDYLSTVSGGGYIGTAFGRLFRRGQDAAAVQAGLAREDTVLLWWLRNNGRYLSPSGARDLLQALASVVRNLGFSLAELGVIVLFLGGLMLLPQTMLAMLRELPPTAAWAAGACDAALPSLWLPIAIVPLLWCTHAVFAYWFCRERPDVATRAADVLFVGGAAALGVLLAMQLAGEGCAQPGPKAVLRAVLAAVLFTPLSGAVDNLACRAWRDRTAWRLRCTKSLALGLYTLAILLAVAGIDVASNWLARHGPDLSGFRLPTAAGLYGLAVVAARWALPLLERFQRKAGRLQAALPLALNVVGLVVLALLVLLGAALLQYIVASAAPWSWWPARPLEARERWALVLGLAVLYLLLTRHDIATLNLSSMHNFYRARLERTYVSTGNVEGSEARFPAPGPLGPSSREAIAHLGPLVEARATDDVRLRDYAPHRQGGPIHLVNCCINQTVDDRTGAYNADRRGIALTLSAFGHETGTQWPQPFAARDVLGDAPLSRWVAISGAALGSGMGSSTRPGHAALLFLTGVRLGFWTLRENVPGNARRPSKALLLVSELLARFPGLGAPVWYVSDGGHFENTGVYALLKRRVRLVVVADCGADPGYAFDDLQNLVRKAQVDYGASIDLLDPASLAMKAGPAATPVLALATTAGELRSREGAGCVLLARIGYDRGPCGLLVLVKPRLVPGVPLEVSGYAAGNAAFPQQPTADQFFDEAQWEAYHQLGLRIGAQLDGAALTALLNAL